MGRLGMELGIAPRLLQSRRVGRMGRESVSSAEPVVSPASGVLQGPAGIWRKLGVSAAELSATDTALSTSEQTLGTRQSSRREQTCAADSRYEAGNTANAGYETRNTDDARNQAGNTADQARNTSDSGGEARHTADARYETGNTADAGCKTWHRAEADSRCEAGNTADARCKACG